jgi:hypothetical protein
MKRRQISSRLFFPCLVSQLSGDSSSGLLDRKSASKSFVHLSRRPCLIVRQSFRDMFRHAAKESQITPVSQSPHLLYRIDLDQIWVPEKTQPCHSEHGVEYINHVPRTISNPTLVNILSERSAPDCVRWRPSPYLTLQDEITEFLRVKPVQLLDHRQTTHHPPAVTHILKFLGPAVETSVWQLAFTEPRSKPVNVHHVQSSRDTECANTCEDLASMRFGSGSDTVSSIEIRTLPNVSYGFVDVDQLHQVQDRKGIEGTVEESSIRLSPLIACERARMRILQPGNVCLVS